MSETIKQCEVCHGDPALCDVHDCGDAHKIPPITGYGMKYYASNVLVADTTNGAAVIGSVSLFKPNHTLCFMRDGVELGKLDFNGPKMVFSGDVDSSTKHFTDHLLWHFNNRVQALVKEGVEATAQTCDPLADFQEGQWWVKELDLTAACGTDDQKRAVAVVHNLISSAQQTVKALPTCEKHMPKGGARSGCVICEGEKLQAALSTISYLCGEANDMELSAYDIHYDENAVVEQVRQKVKATMVCDHQVAVRLEAEAEVLHESAVPEAYAYWKGRLHDYYVFYAYCPLCGMKLPDYIKAQS